MADRRMFTRKITDDDHFIELSASAQALYLHLMMSADDDGFCNQISASMFKSHSSVQDLEALLERRYLLQFESGVIVIKHWRMANSLRKDRYTPTAFQNELKKLKLKDNGAYQMCAEDDANGCQMVASWLPDGCHSIDKISIDKDSKDNNTALTRGDIERIGGFEALWNAYPKKQGKKQAYAAYLRDLKRGVTPEEMMTGIKAYCEHIRRKHIEPDFIKMGSTFFNQRAWEDDWTDGESSDDQVESTGGRSDLEDMKRFLESMEG